MKGNKVRKSVAFVLSLIFAGMTLVGCGAKSPIDETAIAATLGDEKITLKEVNFWAKYQEAITNTSNNYYYAMLVNSGYEAGEAATMAQQYGGKLDEVKDNVMESLETFYIMKQHADEYGVTISEEDKKEIAEVADQFLKDNKKSVKTLMTADRDLVIDILTTYTIYYRMIPFMEEEGLNKEVTDEEALMKTYSYIYISFDDQVDEDGKKISYTETQKVQEGNKLQEFVNEFRKSNSTKFDEAAEEAGYTVSRHSYSPTDKEDTLIDMNKKAEAMKVGEVSDVIELTSDGKVNGVAILRFDTDKDLEAMEAQKATILNERRADCFEAVLDGWKKEADFKVDEKAVETITMDNYLIQKIEEE